MTQDTDSGVPTVTADALRARIERGEDVFVVDARNVDDYEEWRIDGPTVDSVNIPYFTFLDDDLPRGVDALPDDRRLTVVCAKGGASELVVEKLAAAGYDAEHLDGGMTEWARVYEANDVDTDGDVLVRQYHRPSSGCLAYLVASDGEAAVVDPLRAFTERYVADARDLGVSIEHAVDTHIHADHVSGVRDLAARTGATVVLPERADARGVDYDDAYETVADGDSLAVGTAALDVLAAPGHTSGMTAYRVDGVLFTGDSLFLDSVARPDLEDDDPDAVAAAARTLHGTLRSFLDRADDTLVAPAHVGGDTEPAADGTYTRRLGDLAASLDALSMSEDAFVDFVLADVTPRPANYAAIIDINLGARDASAEDAFELELGPNNCAVSTE